MGLVKCTRVTRPGVVTVFTYDQRTKTKKSEFTKTKKFLYGIIIFVDESLKQLGR